MKTSLRSALESAILIAGIASIWPYTAGYRSGWYEAGLAVILALLIAVAVARWRRFRRALSDWEERQRKN